MDGGVDTLSYTKCRGNNKKKNAPIKNKEDQTTHRDPSLTLRPFYRQQEGTIQNPENLPSENSN